MLMIRFQRIGRRNDPAFRMLVLEKASGPKAGTYVAQVGTYNPKTKDFSADAEAIKSWIAKGAQLSPSLQNLLIAKGVVEGKKSAAVVKQKNLTKNIAKKAEEEAKAAAAAEAATVAEPTEAEVTAEAVEAPVEEAPAEEAKEETPAAA
jgi:small subunit ribosomal protein S16